MAEAVLEANKRDKKGKQAAKRIRAEGDIPGILYGPDEKPSMLSVNGKDLLAFLHNHGRNTVVDLTLGKDDSVKAFIYEIQHDPISGDIIHVDFKHISLKEKLEIAVPVHVTGVPSGVKNEGGILEHILHTVDVLCLPTDIPDEIVVDVSEMEINDTIHVSELPAGKFEYLTEPENAVLHVSAPRMIELEEEEEEGLGEEEPLEPELIGEESEEEEEASEEE